MSNTRSQEAVSLNESRDPIARTWMAHRVLLSVQLVDMSPTTRSHEAVPLNEHRTRSHDRGWLTEHCCSSSNLGIPRNRSCSVNVPAGGHVTIFVSSRADSSGERPVTNVESSYGFTSGLRGRLVLFINGSALASLVLFGNFMTVTKKMTYQFIWIRRPCVLFCRQFDGA